MRFLTCRYDDPGPVAQSAQMARAATLLLLLALMVAACVGPMQPSPSVAPDDTPHACPGALLEGELLADDGDGFIVLHEAGFVTPIAWPEGYTVRDGDDGVRELIGPDGAVVAREGDLVALGGGMLGDNSAYQVCGDFRVDRQD